MHWDMLSPHSLVQPVLVEAMERLLSLTISKANFSRVKVREMQITVATLSHTVRAQNVLLDGAAVWVDRSGRCMINACDYRHLHQQHLQEQSSHDFCHISKRFLLQWMPFLGFML